MKAMPKRWLKLQGVLALVLAQFLQVSPGALAQERVIRYEWNNTPAALKILFIGNSFTYTIPQIFAGLVKSGGKPAKVSMAAYPSYSLEEHLKNGNTMNALQREGPWDYVVLQERSFFPIRAQQRMESACSEFDTKIRAAKAKTVMMMTWANKGEQGHQPIISGEYKKVSRNLGATLVSVGDVMTNAMNQDSSIEFYQPDAHHGNEACAYLAACMLYTTLVGDVKHVPMDVERSLNLSESEIDKLRALASGGSAGRTAAGRSRTTTTSGRSTPRSTGKNSGGSSSNTVQTYRWK